MSNLSEAAKAAVKLNFPDVRASFGEAPSPIITIPAVHPEFGALEVLDDEVELTVDCGRFTHVHLSDYDEGVSAAERDRRVVESLVAFLREVFADRMEFWGSPRGGGGCRARPSQGAVSAASIGSPGFVWSGPLDGRETGSTAP